MRTILFRGKGTGEKDKNIWYEGHYARLDDTTYCVSEDYESAAAEGRDPRHYYIIMDYPSDWGLPNRHLRADIRPETLCQHIGKYDMWNKAIYENDIVDVIKPSGSDLYLVEYRKDVAAFVLTQGEIYTCFDAWSPAVKFEVVGNKFDNPDLLSKVPQFTPESFTGKLDSDIKKADTPPSSNRGYLLSSIRAFLDDRGHSWRYNFSGGVISLSLRDRNIYIWHNGDGYSVRERNDDVLYFSSQRDVINKVIIPLLGNAYKEV